MTGEFKIFFANFKKIAKVYQFYFSIKYFLILKVSRFLE